MVSASEIEWDASLAGDSKSEAVTCVSNKVRILATLTGEAGEEIEVLTLRWKEGVLVLSDDRFLELHSKLLLPKWVAVEIGDDVREYRAPGPPQLHRIEPEYLLFLRKFGDRGYVPVTGQQWGAMSVRLLNK